MAELKVRDTSDSIVIRFILPSVNASEIREELKDDFTNIPKLNKDTFESFGDWVFEEISDSIIQTLVGIRNNRSANDRQKNEQILDDESSEIEPW